MYGPRNWWPAETDFEVMVGAILTQNTNWSNVEKAIAGLKRHKLLSPVSLNKSDIKVLARLIRPCGYYNVKSRRLKEFVVSFFKKYRGRLSYMRKKAVSALRKELLGIKGIGPETADSIILYAVKKPIFVIDAYTKRILACLGLAKEDSQYDEVQSIFMQNLPRSVKLFNEYHALLVEHAKRVCKKKPLCENCILHSLKYS
jgi:endonuclease-3 related protein